MLERSIDKCRLILLFIFLTVAANCFAESECPGLFKSTITIYKGITRPPNKVSFDLSGFSKSELWFSRDLDTARSFARNEREPGTVLELEIPAKFFSPVYLSPDGTISTHEVPNLLRYLKRIGITKGGKIKWISREEARKLGFLK